MVFTESKFLIFLALVYGVFWLLPKQNQRMNWLLGCSYLFYSSWDWRFTSLLLISTVADYYAAIGIYQSTHRNLRRFWMGVSLTVNLGILGVFKYFDFFSQSFADLAQVLGFRCDPFLLNVVLPVGVSFYTFQTLSYTLDIYRGDRVLYRSLRDFALFVSFFPQLVAGPIVRGAEFLPQIKKLFPYQSIDFRGAALLMAAGYFKKAVIADNIAFYVDPVFVAPLDYQVISVWMAAFGYSVQLYTDFSGYSDIAMGMAKLFGIELPSNFRYPLFSTGVGDVWRRWHLTLSNWIHDYVYLPLGGTSTNAWLTARNMLITMTLIGLWHGANAKFLFFGVVNGLALIVEYRFRLSTRGILKSLKRSGRYALLIPIAATIYGLLTTTLIMVIFRAPTIGLLGEFMSRLIGLGSPGTKVVHGHCLIFLCSFWSIHLLSRLHWQPWVNRWNSLDPVSFAAGYGFLWALLFSMAIRAYRPFVYFAF